MCELVRETTRLDIYEDKLREKQLLIVEVI